MQARSMLLAADPGCGKTAVGLKLAEYRKAHPVRTGRTLVIAPLSLLELAWEADRSVFTPGLTLANLWAPTPKKREKALQDAARADICVVNPEGFRKIMSWCEQQRFDNLIVDESSMLANPRAQITKAVMRFSYNVPFVYPLSGTPMPNTPLDIYAQIHICDHGILPGNFYRFRAVYAYPAGYMGYEWRVSPESRERLMRDIASRTIFIAKDDCLDLPAQTFVARRVYMSSDQRAAYDKMLKDKILPLLDGKEIIASNVLTEIMKLRQITSGWLYDENKRVYNFTNTKQAVLDEVLNEIGCNQAIIWVQFVHDAEQLTNHLLNARAPGSTAKIVGGMKPSDLKAQVEAFKAGTYRYLVAHPKTIGHGVTLTNCRYAIFYSLSYSWQEFKQSADRIHRISQHHPVEYFALLCHKSIDEAIYRAVRNKQSMNDAARDFVREISNARG